MTAETEAGASVILNQAAGIASSAQDLADQAAALALAAGSRGPDMAAMSTHGSDFLMMGLTVLVLACFVGYYVVWRVTPALHAPLMAMTNAISSVVIVGALIAAGLVDGSVAKAFGFFAVMLASINIFGGFIVTRRMLAMFKRKS